MHESENVLARDRGKGLARQLVPEPREDSACPLQNPLAGLWLQPSHMAQVIQISGQQWAIRIRYHATRRCLKPIGYDTSCVRDHRLSGDARRSY